MDLKRETFQSRLGFLLVSAGCAVGIGNVWKFPYVVGQNGGGIFVLIYLLFLVIMGLPILTMELAVGRGSRKSAVGGYRALEPPKSKWHIHGWVAMAGCYILMMYYTTVSGWMVSYFYKFVTGAFTADMDVAACGNIFAEMLASPGEMLVAMALTVAIGFLICSRGLQKGLERISKVMMVGLILLIVVLVAHSLSLSGAAEGLKFYLVPNVESVKTVGIGQVIVSAMNQSFYTLSLGIAAMEIFGSYMDKGHTLLSEGIHICLLDTFVALMAGLIIFPACFSYGVEADAGPGLIFITLPNVFVNMVGGRLWGSLFFLFMTFASFSTVLAIFENLLSFTTETFGWSRKKASICNAAVVLVAGVPCVFGYNLWKDVTLIGGRDILDSEDFLVSNLLLPIGSLVYLLFCVTKWGWGFQKYQQECNTGKGLKIQNWMKPYFQFVLPVLILLILVFGLL